MNRSLSAVVALGGLAALVVLAPGCGTVRKGSLLTYDEYLSIDTATTPTPTADTVLSKLGMPKSVHDRNGVRRRIDYHTYTLNGDMKTAEFSFDENEKLVKKELW
jgi:hypothetical protein